MASITNDKLIEWTAELAKECLGNSHTPYNPRDIAEFMQAFYDKLAELKINDD